MTTAPDNWKMLIIDEGPGFFDWATSHIEGYTFENNAIQLLFAPVQDMVARIKEHYDLNIIILKLTSSNHLMCLEVVRYLRTGLKNTGVRILFIYEKAKTIPDEAYLNQYDISDIRTTKGLTPLRWRTLTRNILKGYVSKQREAILDSVFQVSQYEKGSAYLESLIRNLGMNLGYRYTFIGMVNEDHTVIRTKTVWGKGRILDNFEYFLEDTPCEKVLTGNRVCIHTQGVKEAYPKDKLLQDMGMDSYMGCPILNPDGQILGLLATLDDKPMKETGIHRPIMEFFAGRIGIEFEREHHSQRMTELNAELESKVKERTTELKKTHETMLELAHQAGMAEIASGVLHNIGNVLNSITTATDILGEALANSELKTLTLANQLISEHQDHLDTFFRDHPKGKILPDFFKTLEGVLKKEQVFITKENDIIRSNATIINQVIKTQQDYAGKDGILTRKSLAAIMDHTLEMMGAILARHLIKIVKNYQEIPLIPVHKTRLIQILTNLVKNAIEAMLNHPPENRILSLTLYRTDDQMQCLQVEDNGIGIKEEHMEKLFNFGFTTKKEGTGFGLHSSINFVHQCGGHLSAQSKGEDKGAIFTLKLPENQNLEKTQAPPLIVH